MMSVAFIRGAHGEQLPPVPGLQQLSPVMAAPPASQWQTVVGDVDEARVFAAAG